MMLRKNHYKISLILQTIFILLFSAYIGYTFGKYSEVDFVSDFIIAVIFIAILFLATMLLYRDSYYEQKPSIYLTIYYLSPVVLIGLSLIMTPDVNFSVGSGFGTILIILYLINGLNHTLSIFGKETN
ncbi:MAG TPA: hypothetical protein GX698_01305 [Acholeplasmataceae bacterium]|nr:hypothetical protein [Acholeplasmataceae bacterium]